GKAANVKLPAEVAQKMLAAIAAPPTRPTRAWNQTVMRAWRDLVPDEMERTSLVRTLARSTQIVGRMLDQIAQGKTTPPVPAALTRAGQVLWGFVEIAVPRSPAELIGKYWVWVLYAMSVLIIIAGSIGSSEMTRVGWSVLGATALAQFIVLTL